MFPGGFLVQPDGLELGPTGVRVLDRGKVHQDHAVAVRGVVAQFASGGIGIEPSVTQDPGAIDWSSVGPDGLPRAPIGPRDLDTGRWGI